MEWLDHYPVVVVGGGPGGIMAALSAARNGARTLLIEQGAFLGGTATRSLIGPISPFHFGDEQIVRGPAQELIDRMVRYGGATGHLKCINPTGTGSYVCLYDHETYKYVAQEMLLEAGVDLMFHARVERVLQTGWQLEGVQVTTRFGGRTVGASVVVDASGDGDVAVMCGESWEYGNGKGQAQPSSLMFEMAEVDVERLYAHILDHPQDFTRRSDLITVKDHPVIDNRPLFVAQGYIPQVRAAVERGELHFGRSDVHTVTGFHPGWIHFNSVRLSGYDSLDLSQRDAAEIDGRRQMESIAQFMKRYIPGFEHAYIARAGCEIGVRETRHIQGCYRLTAEDVAGGKKFADVISRGGFAIDIHGAKEAPGVSGAAGFWQELRDCYDIPYRAVVPAHVDGLLLAGRCISGESAAHASFRTQGVVMGLSQAVGTAAALCARLSIHPRDLDVKLLQRTLIAMNASPFRDRQQRERELCAAHAAVRRFVAQHPRCITEKCYL